MISMILTKNETFNDKIDKMVSLGKIQPNEELELKIYYIGNIKFKRFILSSNLSWHFPKNCN